MAGASAGGAGGGLAGEVGVLRLMMKYDPHFFTFLEIPEVLSIVDRV
ncbi:hypothetical protein GR254_19405, partial [Mycobacterium tuberculosis]|nr:hypothetical protein [Mycobacterium tuberculosis]